MIKVQNNIAIREPLPVFLLGLQIESLADLSWTDPQLGVSDCKWLPEIDQSPALGVHERHGDETLAISGGSVIVTRSVVPWSAEEIEAERKASVPQSVTMRQARLALLGAGLLDDVEAAIDAQDEPLKSQFRIEWDYATEVDRQWPTLLGLMPALGLTGEQVDALFVAAAKL